MLCRYSRCNNFYKSDKRVGILSEYLSECPQTLPKRSETTSLRIEQKRAFRASILPDDKIYRGRSADSSKSGHGRDEAMASKKSGSTEATKAGEGGQKLGCRLSADEANLLGSLEYLLGGNAGAIVVQGLLALTDSLPKSQQDTISTMMRARNSSLARLKRSCGHVSVDIEQEQAAGQGISEQTINRISQIHSRASLPVDYAINSLSD